MLGWGSTVFSSNDVLEPKDLALLRQVLEDVCQNRGIEVSHRDAGSIAHDLVNWYLFGIRQPDALKSIILPLQLP